jgi:hypothetical protein
MDGGQHSIARDSNGRFQPGVSGNPAAKKPGVAERVVDPLASTSSRLRSTTDSPSPPASRGERDAQGWRGAAEPYPKLGEGGAAAAPMPDCPDTPLSIGAAHPHPAPAKLDDVSLSLRIPLPHAGEEII